jgi:predicted ATPase with chaperone activity
MIAMDTPTTSTDFPVAPATLEEAGLKLDLVAQLALKTLHLAGELTGGELAQRLGLMFSVVQPAVELLKQQRLFEIAGGSVFGGPSYRYHITEAGRARGAAALEQNHYVGAAPVPLDQYRRYMKKFDSRLSNQVTRQRLREAFSRLVVSDTVLDQLGPAINARHSMFVYGPPGNGKTVISQAIRNLQYGDIAIPRALEVEGAIIRFYDPVNHEAIPLEQDSDRIDLPIMDDPRWVRCQRPMVMVGGELTLDALELKFNPATGFYTAPIQALAGGGVLVIDDFGRQNCPPRDLLNRWIVPLESRVDFMTLLTGQKFELPFTTMVVFATNIKPHELVDEAFLRRIQYKIFAESPTVPDFIKIFENYCHDVDVEFDRSLVEQMLSKYYRPRKIQLRGCQPRDLINHALSLASYRGEPRRLTYELLEAACAGYFVDDTEAPPVYA